MQTDRALRGLKKSADFVLLKGSRARMFTLHHPFELFHILPLELQCVLLGFYVAVQYKAASNNEVEENHTSFYLLLIEKHEKCGIFYSSSFTLMPLVNKAKMCVT